jgi:hypothetical protein
VTGQQITPAVRAAVDAARRAMNGPAGPHGAAETIVLALDAAGLLQDPERAAELYRLRQERAALNGIVAGADEERALLRARLAELQPYEALHPQFCEAGQHRGWFADSDGPLPCPWCETARAQESARRHYRVEHDGIERAVYSSADAAGTHAESALREQIPGAVCEWIPMPGTADVLDMVTHHYGHTSATGWTVTTVTVQTEYAPAPAVTG